MIGTIVKSEIGNFVGGKGFLVMHQEENIARYKICLKMACSVK